MNWLEEVDQKSEGLTRPVTTNGASGPAAPDEQPTAVFPATATTPPTSPGGPVDLATRRDELARRVAELQWDLGGLVYEMAIRDHVRVDVLVRRAAVLQEVDAELAEVDRILRHEESGTAGSCATCGSLHSRGAAYCWQCGTPLVAQIPTEAIGGA
jgi:hypothetical protein